MGLQEKKWKKSIEGEHVIEFQNDVKGFLDVLINVEFDWDSFQSIDEMKFIPTYSLHRIRSAFRDLSNDVDAKEEIIEQIKTIKIINITEDPENNKSIKLSEGVMEFAVGFGGNHSSVFNELAIKDYLENNL